MADGRWPKRSWLARGLALVGGIALFCAAAPLAHAQRLLNESLAGEGTAQPIELFADHAAVWEEAGQRIHLLRGNVYIRQGSATIRTADAVVWVDLARSEKDRAFPVMIYGERGITLEHSGAAVTADLGYVRLATSNDVPLKTRIGKILKEAQISDRTYLRALANRPDVARRQLDRPAPRPPASPAPRVDDMLRLASGQEPVAPLPPPPTANPSAIVNGASQLGKQDSAGQAPIQVKTTYLQLPGDAPVAPAPRIPGASPPPPVFPNPTPAPPPPSPPAALQPRKAQPQISIRPRYNGTLNFRSEPSKTEPGVTAVIVTGTAGVMVLVNAPPTTPAGKPMALDIEADRIVLWTRGDAQRVFQDMTGAGSDNDAHEIYLSGNVELRTRTAKEIETLRADEVYYDVRRGVAVARKADLEIQSKKILRPLHLWTEELIQVNPKLYQAKGVGVFSSINPSDPGLVFEVQDATVEERQYERSYLWGLVPAYDKNGKRIVDTERTFTGRNLVSRLEGVPVFYFPYLRDNIEDPLGPLEGFNMSYNRILGFQVYTTWDMYDLLSLPHFEGTRWRLMLDYLTDRGPAFGTAFDFAGRDLFGVKSSYSGMVKLYGIFDRGEDILGGNRGQVVYWPNAQSPWTITHPDFRGWAYGKVNVQELPNGFSVLGQFSFIRDRNFLEQFFFNTHLNEPNQNTYLSLTQRQDNWAWSLFGQISVREWMTETDWLPKADGFLTGQTFLDDWLVYNARASVGYGRLRPTNDVPFAYLPTDVRTDALRLDLLQDLSVPFYLGPVKLAPYAVLDTAYYSNDVYGDQRGRLYGGGGVRANLPLSRLYPDIQSDLFNLNGIYHKINLTGNYFNAGSSSRFTNFPQMDRLNDDVTDQALRDIRPQQSVLNPANAAFLTGSPLFDPQNYIIRRLIDSNVDTLDQIEVLQLGLRQRWQTKRGFPGSEHVIDWMTLNLGASIFPRSDRDNFGNTFGILEYDWVWNIGDRTALTSSGWFEPFDGGPRAFDVGAVLERPDSTRFYFGYRQIDPVNSKAVVATVVYPFSAKYAMTANTVWDFGVDVRTYSLFLSRMGTDLFFNFGLTYNSTVNTFGVAVEVLPNLARRGGRSAGLFPTAGTNIDPLVNVR